MLELQKLSDVELDNIKEIIQKGIEKSDLERYYLFTTDIKEKAKLFCYCHRFLCHLHNIIVTDSLRDIVKKEIDLTFNKYVVINELLYQCNILNFGKHALELKLQRELFNDKICDNLIDCFAVLLERANLLDINKIQAFVLEGKSKDEYNKIFKDKNEKIVEDVSEELLPETTEESNIEEEYQDSQEEQDEIVEENK